jgi:murein L,D-transpeptidase YcbB/YkuD
MGVILSNADYKEKIAMFRNFKRAACAALLISCIPSVASAAAPATAAASASSLAALTPARALDTFYSQRNGAPLWLSSGPRSPAAMQLVSTLRQSTVDGFNAGPELAAEAEVALARAATGNPAAIGQADRLLSTAWIMYVQALKRPSMGMVYSDERVAPRSVNAFQIISKAAAAGSLENHVASASQINPLYAELRQAALNEMPLGSSQRLDPRLATSLDRARALPSTGRYVAVDAAAQKLFMIDDGRIVDTMKVVVGKPTSQTPMIASMIHYATLNPYWNVPSDLSQKLIAPRVLEQGVSYLKERRYEVLSGFEDDAQPVDPATIDWKAVASGETAIRVRQLPGAHNAMGNVKFSFPNSAGIYLHDTDDKSLFAKDDRTLSNGCVRLEDAERLGRWLFGTMPRAASADPEQHVALPTGVPVYLTYLTAQPAGGQIAFVDDVYGRDSGAGSMMASARR